MNLLPCWRWFGKEDNITLDNIKMTGAKGIVTALHNIPIGNVWDIDRIQEHKHIINQKGMEWNVVESIPVHESIKYGGEDRDKYIKNFIDTMINISKCGINIICYNFMPIVDWTRTDLFYPYNDGSYCLRFDIIDFIIFDVLILKRDNADSDYNEKQIMLAKEKFLLMNDKDKKKLTENILKGLPGCMVESYNINGFKQLLIKYANVDKKKLRENLKYFLNKIIPLAIKHDIYLGIHPDDPPLNLFGIPRIVSDIDDLIFIFDCNKDYHHGLTLCLGSLCSSYKNDPKKIIEIFKDRVNFLHLRNIQKTGEGLSKGTFIETDHLDGDIDMSFILKQFIHHNKNFPIPFRPDHGLLIMNEQNMYDVNPGYSLFGRMKGLSQLLGIIYSLNNSINESSPNDSLLLRKKIMNQKKRYGNF
tara:strand:- start:643 stop:1893 length:1251 start_codon:yes stop_codon:yes gene_type:complete